MIEQLHIITGEYPPQPGGVADYTRLVAEGLFDLGVDVHVWVTRIADRVDEFPEAGPSIHRGQSFSRIAKALDLAPRPRRILVQFAPNAFSAKGMNFGLGAMLTARKFARDQVRIMFHEVTYMLKPGDSTSREMLVFGQRLIARRLLRAADVVDIAIPHWEKLLRPLDSVQERIYEWLPVPSNVPILSDPEGVSAIRREWAAVGVSTLIGSFGTFAKDVESMLAGLVIPVLKKRPDLGMVLIGRDSKKTAARWLKTSPELMGRVYATGPCGLDNVSRHLQTADLLVQPYPGGVCGKRGSLMAGIAHGRPTLTTSGLVTEPLWVESEAVALCDESVFTQAQPLLEALLDDPEARTRFGWAGRTLYDEEFDLRHTLETLASPADWTS